MKRIAIMSPMFTGSLMPLVRHLREAGIEVDYFFMTLDNEIVDPEGFNGIIKSHKLGVSYISYNFSESLASFFGGQLSGFYCIRLLHQYSAIPILRLVMKRLNRFYFKRIHNFINKQQYDLINYVGVYNHDFYVPFLEGIKLRLVISLHEVCNHLQPDFNKPSNLIQLVIKRGLDVIVHSNKSRNDILRYYGLAPNRVHLIKFGLFESFLTIESTKELHLPPKYYLFIGSISKYKGIQTLCNAMDSVSSDISLVIAGKGHDGSLDYVSNNIQVINRYISNSEFIQLVRNCYCVICPYLSSSQSGIPQVAFLFNKPIIASNLTYWNDILCGGKLGFLFETGNSEELRNAIISLWDNEKIINGYTDNIKSFRKQRNDSNWSVIVEKYMDLIQ